MNFKQCAFGLAKTVAIALTLALPLVAAASSADARVGGGVARPGGERAGENRKSQAHVRMLRRTAGRGHKAAYTQGAGGAASR